MDGDSDEGLIVVFSVRLGGDLAELTAREEAKTDQETG